MQKVHVLFKSVSIWCAVKLKKNTTYKISLLKLKTSFGKLCHCGIRLKLNHRNSMQNVCSSMKTQEKLLVIFIQQQLTTLFQTRSSPFTHLTKQSNPTKIAVFFFIGIVPWCEPFVLYVLCFIIKNLLISRETLQHN